MGGGASKGPVVITASKDGAIRWYKSVKDDQYDEYKMSNGLSRISLMRGSNDLVAISCDDGLLSIYNIKSKSTVVELQAHGTRCIDAQFSSSSKYLATAGEDKTVKLFNVSTWKMMISLEKHTDRVNSVCFSPDDRRLLSCSHDDTAILWSIPDGASLYKLKGHRRYILKAIFSPDSNLIATSSRDKCVRLWQGAKGKRVCEMEGHRNTVLTLAFSPDGTVLASGSDDQSIMLWDTTTKSLISDIKGSAAVTSLLFTPDGETLFAGYADGAVRLSDLAGNVIHRFINHSGDVRSCSLFLPTITGDFDFASQIAKQSGFSSRQMIPEVKVQMTVAEEGTEEASADGAPMQTIARGSSAAKGTGSFATPPADDQSTTVTVPKLEPAQTPLPTPTAGDKDKKDKAKASKDKGKASKDKKKPAITSTPLPPTPAGNQYLPLLASPRNENVYNEVLKARRGSENIYESLVQRDPAEILYAQVRFFNDNDDDEPEFKFPVVRKDGKITPATTYATISTIQEDTEQMYVARSDSKAGELMYEPVEKRAKPTPAGNKDDTLASYGFGETEGEVAEPTFSKPAGSGVGTVKGMSDPTDSKSSTMTSESMYSAVNKGNRTSTASIISTESIVPEPTFIDKKADKSKGKQEAERTASDPSFKPSASSESLQMKTGSGSRTMAFPVVETKDRSHSLTETSSTQPDSTTLKRSTASMEALTEVTNQKPPGNPEDWTVSQVSDWLRAINLDQYIASFAEAKIDGTCLVVGLDDDSLQELNVSMKIHRKKIENELKKLFPS